MKNTTTWALIADGARAHIVLSEGPDQGLRPALDHDFAAPHGYDRDAGTDKPGRGRNPGSGGHSYGHELTWHEYQKERFAKDMAEVVNKAASQNAFDKLVIAAPPKALGDLRDHLNKPAQERLSGEVHKDLTHIEKLSELEPHLKDVMVF